MHLLIVCLLGIFMLFLSSADFKKKKLFQKIISGIPSEWQTVWIHNKAQHSVGPDLGPNCLERLSADATIR